MFLEIEGLKLPDYALLHTVYSGIEIWKGGKPSWATPLGETFWTDEEKKKVTDIFKRAGIPDPMKQKLVEPFAIAFGGKNKEGVPDLSKVNWEALIEFFEWESYSIQKTKESKAISEKLQNKAEKKWGGIFFHYLVYEDYSNQRDNY
jgi:hypothetical protein